MPDLPGSKPERLPLPHLSDEARWRAIKGKHWKGIRNEDLAAALRARQPGKYQRVIDIIAERLHGEMRRILLRSVKRSYPDRGEDIIAEAQSRLWAALMNPESKSGAGLCESFEARVWSFGTDAVRRHLGHAKKDGKAAELTAPDEGPNQDVAAQLRIDVKRLIGTFPNPRQLRVCMLLLDGLPLDPDARSNPAHPDRKKGFQTRVAEEVGVSTRTIRTWVREFSDRFREAREQGLI